MSDWDEFGDDDLALGSDDLVKLEKIETLALSQPLRGPSQPHRAQVAHGGGPRDRNGLANNTGRRDVVASSSRVPLHGNDPNGSLSKRPRINLTHSTGQARPSPSTRLTPSIRSNGHHVDDSMARILPESLTKVVPPNPHQVRAMSRVSSGDQVIDTYRQSNRLTPPPTRILQQNVTSTKTEDEVLSLRLDFTKLKSELASAKKEAMTSRGESSLLRSKINDLTKSHSTTVRDLKKREMDWQSKAETFEKELKHMKNGLEADAVFRKQQLQQQQQHSGGQSQQVSARKSFKHQKIPSTTLTRNATWTPMTSKVLGLNRRSAYESNTSSSKGSHRIKESSRDEMPPPPPPISFTSQEPRQLAPVDPGPSFGTFRNAFSVVEEGRVASQSIKNGVKTPTTTRSKLFLPSSGPEDGFIQTAAFEDISPSRQQTKKSRVEPLLSSSQGMELEDAFDSNSPIQKGNGGQQNLNVKRDRVMQSWNDFEDWDTEPVQRDLKSELVSILFSHLTIIQSSSLNEERRCYSPVPTLQYLMNWRFPNVLIQSPQNSMNKQVTSIPENTSNDTRTSDVLIHQSIYDKYCYRIFSAIGQNSDSNSIVGDDVTKDIMTFVTLIIGSLVRITHLLSQSSESWEPLSACLDLTCSLCQITPLVITFILDHPDFKLIDLPPPIESDLVEKSSSIDVLIEVVRQCSLPRHQKEEEEEAEEEERRLKVLSGWFSIVDTLSRDPPESCLPCLEKLIKSQGVFCTLLQFDQVSEVICRSIGLLSVLACQPLLFRSIMACPFEISTPPSTNSPKSVALIECLSRFLLPKSSRLRFPTTLRDRALDILGLLMILSVKHSDAPILLRESENLVPTLIRLISKDTTWLWQSYGSKADLKKSDLITRRLELSTGLLQHLTFLRNQTYDFLSALRHFQLNGFPGLHHELTVSFAKLVWASQPDWLPPLHSSRVSRTSELAQQIMDLVAVSDEQDELYFAVTDCQAVEEDEDDVGTVVGGGRVGDTSTAIAEAMAAQAEAENVVHAVDSD